MPAANESALTNLFPTAPWLLEPPVFQDPVSFLSGVLGDSWNVERCVDCDGDISMVVLPIADLSGMDAYILYEQDGLTLVATIKDDEWSDKQTFSSFARAVNHVHNRARGIVT